MYPKRVYSLHLLQLTLYRFSICIGGHQLFHLSEVNIDCGLIIGIKKTAFFRGNT